MTVHIGAHAACRRSMHRSRRMGCCKASCSGCGMPATRAAHCAPRIRASPRPTRRGEPCDAVSQRLVERCVSCSTPQRCACMSQLHANCVGSRDGRCVCGSLSCVRHHVWHVCLCTTGRVCSTQPFAAWLLYAQGYHIADLKGDQRAHTTGGCRLRAYGAVGRSITTVRRRAWRCRRALTHQSEVAAAPV